MKVLPCDHGPVVAPCTLKNHNFQIDPYIGCEHLCHYCYALNQAETDWSRKILFHRDLPDRLDKELSAIPAQSIYLGWQTDPYQPCEAEYRQTRQVLERLLDRGFSAGILTKSDLVLRDADLLTAMDGASVSTSVAFNDNNVRRLFEANTMDTEARIDALARLRDKGIGTAALICPVIPYITDVIPLVEDLAPYTDTIWIYALSIGDREEKSWQNIEPILDRHFAEVKEDIEAVVFSETSSYWDGIKQELQAMATDKDVRLNIHLP